MQIGWCENFAQSGAWLGTWSLIPILCMSVALVLDPLKELLPRVLTETKIATNGHSLVHVREQDVDHLCPDLVTREDGLVFTAQNTETGALT